MIFPPLIGNNFAVHRHLSCTVPAVMMSIKVDKNLLTAELRSEESGPHYASNTAIIALL